jgi:hypothetical protein
MTTRAIEVRRLAALGAVLLVAPAALFLASAIGRSLQPVAHEPARTLEAVVEAFLALPPTLAVALLVAAPFVAIGLAAFALSWTLRVDGRLRADLRSAGLALVPILRRPTFVVSAVVLTGSFAILVFFAVHAIAG